MVTRRVRWKIRWNRLLIFLRLRKRHEWTVEPLDTYSGYKIMGKDGDL